jgi:two-component system NarL family sensor kinase
VTDGGETLDRLVTAEQDERRRIALFLHDGPVQNLSGIALMLDAVQHAIQTGNTDDAARVLSAAMDRQRATIRELRDLSFALEPVVLRDQGLAAAVQALASQLGSAHRMRIDLDIDVADNLGESAQIALYTLIRELLEQAVRRGPPTSVRIAMAEAPGGGVTTVVSDDAEPERRRRSFEAIEERVKQLHGLIAVEPSSEGGTHVVVTLPAYATRR